MKRVYGNVPAELQRFETVENAIGEKEKTWKTVGRLCGWLDLSNGESKYTNNNAKIQESTHVFITDATQLQANAENGRLLIGNKRYDIMLIDDPMELHAHSEIYLKFTGGQ